MEIWILTIITGVALLYCCDIPIVCDYFSFLVNDKQSLFYGVGLSIIASYIFYIIQVYIPQRNSERQAHDFLEKKINNYLNNLYRITEFCKALCIIDRENNKIEIISPYIEVAEKGVRSKWIEKVEINRYYKLTESEKKRIVTSGYFMQLEYKKRKTLQKLFDNCFMYEFNEHLSDEKFKFVNLIKNYDEFQVYVDEARTIFKLTNVLEIKEYQDKNKIAEFEYRIRDVEKDGIASMCIED